MFIKCLSCGHKMLSYPSVKLCKISVYIFKKLLFIKIFPLCSNYVKYHSKIYYCYVLRKLVFSYNIAILSVNNHSS